MLLGSPMEMFTPESWLDFHVPKTPGNTFQQSEPTQKLLIYAFPNPSFFHSALSYQAISLVIHGVHLQDDDMSYK